jgi:hypothetical protein
LPFSEAVGTKSKRDADPAIGQSADAVDDARIGKNFRISGTGGYGSVAGEWLSYSRVAAFVLFVPERSMEAVEF